MSERPTQRFRPGLERLEAKRPLAAGASTAPVAHLTAGPPAAASPPAVPEATAARRPPTAARSRRTAVKPNFGYLVYRITNPNRSTTR